MPRGARRRPQPRRAPRALVRALDAALPGPAGAPGVRRPRPTRTTAPMTEALFPAAASRLTSRPWPARAASTRAATWPRPRRSARRSPRTPTRRPGARRRPRGRGPGRGGGAPARSFWSGSSGRRCAEPVDRGTSGYLWAAMSHRVAVPPRPESPAIKVDDKRRVNDEGEPPREVAAEVEASEVEAQAAELEADLELATARKRVDELARAYQAGERDREEFKQRLPRERERMIDVERGNVAMRAARGHRRARPLPVWPPTSRRWRRACGWCATTCCARPSPPASSASSSPAQPYDPEPRRGHRHGSDGAPRPTTAG